MNAKDNTFTLRTTHEINDLLEQESEEYGLTKSEIGRIKLITPFKKILKVLGGEGDE